MRRNSLLLMLVTTYSMAFSLIAAAQEGEPTTRGGIEEHVTTLAATRDVNRSGESGTLQGKVVDQNGRPIKGARVELRDDVSRTEESALLGAIVSTMTTGVDGMYAFEHVRRRERYGLRVTHDQLAESTIGPICIAPDASRSIDVTLVEGETVSGKVIDSQGEPIEGADVEIIYSLSSRDRPSLAEDEDCVLRRATTNEKGEFRLDHVTARRIRVMAKAAGHTRSSVLMPDDARKSSIEPLVLELSPGSLIAGRVVDEDDQPVAGARVFAAPESHAARASHGGDRLRARSMDDGSFRIDGLHAGRYGVRAHHAEFEFQEGKTVRTGETVVLKLRRSPSIRGTVVDAESGDPVTAFTLQVGQGRQLLGDHNNGVRRFESADGSYEISGDSKADFTIFADAIGYATSGIVLSAMPAGTKRDDVVIRMMRGVTVEGHLVDLEDAPIAGAHVALIPRPQPGTIEPFAEMLLSCLRAPVLVARSGAHGEFAIENVPEGLFMIRARHEGFALLETDPPFVVPSKGRLTLDPTAMARGGTVRGIVRDIGGVPAVDFKVYLVVPGGIVETVGPTTTDATGSFVFTHVPAGTYKVIAALPNAEPFTRGPYIERPTVILHDGGDLTVEIKR